MPADLNQTVGALLLGVLVTAVGYGITTMQTYLYMSRFPKDPWPIRWTVWSLLALDTTHVMLSWHMVYYYLIVNFDNRPALTESVWSFNITVVLTALITVIVHCFYARRVYILSGGVWSLVVLILSLSVVRIVCGSVVTVKLFILKNLEELPKKITAEVGSGLGAGTLADILITVSLVVMLRRHKSGFNPLDNVLDKIIYWTVNNGAMTSIVGVVVIVTFSVMPENMVFLSVHLLLSKLYANSLLATLNFRSAHRGRGFETDNSITIPMTSMSGSAGGRRVTGSLVFNSPKDSSGQTTTTRSAPVVHILKSTTTDGSEPDYTPQAKDSRSNSYADADAADARPVGVRGDKADADYDYDFDFAVDPQTPSERSGVHAA